MAEKDKKKGKKTRDPKNPYGNYEFNRNVKVSQTSIDKIKDVARKEGIEAAIKRFGRTDAEAVKRLYGQRRYDLYATKGKPSGRPGPNAGSASTAGARKSSPVKNGGGQGYRSAAKPKPTNRANAVALATGATAASVYARGKSLQRRIANMTPAQQKAYAEKVGVRTANLTKFASSPAGKLLGIGSRLTMAGTPILARDIIMAGSGALKKGVSKTKGGEKAIQRYERTGGPGSSRAAQMRRATSRPTKRKGR